MGKRNKTTRIEGVLIDSQYEQPIPNTQVTIEYHEWLFGNWIEEDVSRTDENGRFKLEFKKRHDKYNYYIGVGPHSRCGFNRVHVDLDFQEENYKEVSVSCDRIYMELKMEPSDPKDAVRPVIRLQGDTLLAYQEYVSPAKLGEPLIKEIVHVIPYETVFVDVFQIDANSGDTTHYFYEKFCDPNKSISIHHTK
ncbi:hypothetical protein KFE98_17845 [bacterium SCSIO 12741]|nr:hypothetical protein KFE98_17845 [bacterium SCSIO 12741]